MAKYVQFSSETDKWGTPRDFVRCCELEFGEFDLDVCASAGNAVCGRYFDEAMDGLKCEWGVGLLWMNPPYGRGIVSWIRKAWESSRVEGCRVICLLPGNTDVGWWYEWVRWGRISFIRGRLKFGGVKDSAPFGSVLVEFDASCKVGVQGSVRYVDRELKLI